MPKKKTLVAPSPTIAMEGTEVAVDRVRKVGERTVAIDLPTPDSWSINPGQFVQIGAPVDEEFVVRHYTVSSPYNDGGFEITVGVDPEGDLSPVLAELNEDDFVSVDGPYGRSYYEGEEPVVVIAGGPGVGPAVGIAERVADEHGAKKASVIYRDVEHAHLDRLEELRDKGARVELLEDDELLRGNLDGLPDGAQVFVYGFDGFVNEAAEALEAAGYEGEPKVENFG